MANFRSLPSPVAETLVNRPFLSQRKSSILCFEVALDGRSHAPEMETQRTSPGGFANELVGVALKFIRESSSASPPTETLASFEKYRRLQ